MFAAGSLRPRTTSATRGTSSPAATPTAATTMSSRTSPPKVHRQSPLSLPRTLLAARFSGEVCSDRPLVFAGMQWRHPMDGRSRPDQPKERKLGRQPPAALPGHANADVKCAPENEEVRPRHTTQMTGFSPWRNTCNFIAPISLVG